MLAVSSQDLRTLNTLGLRSHAAAMVRYTKVEQLTALSELAARYRHVFVLGGGSNVVLAPQLESLLIKVESRGVRLLKQTDTAFIVEAQAGEVWHDFVAGCLDKGWYGLENLALIPGTVGAAPVQNIGAYGVELDQRFHSLTAWDIHNSRLVEMNADECQFSYRNSFFKMADAGRWLILSLRFSLPKLWEPVLEYPDLQAYAQSRAQGVEISPRQVFDAVCDIRRQKLPDPAVLGNAGSFFKNPVIRSQDYQTIKAKTPELIAYLLPDGSYKLAAGWLIDRAGWKGRRVGVIGTHDRQALVLVNYGGADANDVNRIAHLIKTDVDERFGVMLEQEPVFVS